MSSGPLSYSEWTVKLCHSFFSERNMGQPVTLFVDDELLASLAGIREELAVESLCSAVRSRLGEANAGLFKPILLEWTVWKREQKGCPPSLPLLAVAVLAAHRMERDLGIAAHNYYVRFRELLDLPQRPGGEPRGYGEAFPVLWRGLKDWMNDVQGGRFGVSTLPTHPVLPYIGFALSQARFRESDRQRLTSFFQWLQLSPGEEMEERELVAHFRNWVRGGRSISPGFQNASLDSGFEEQLGQILVAAAKQWDGVVRDEAGRKVGTIHVTLEQSFPRPQLGFAARRPIGVPASVILDSPDRDEHFELTAISSEWFGPIAVPITPVTLKQGIALLGDDVRLVYQPSRIIALRQEISLGRWCSAASVVPESPHWLLVRDSEVRRVEAFLTDFALTGWRTSSSGAPEGWTLISDVRIADVIATETVDEDLWHLIPAVRNRPSLSNGLPLQGGSATYLMGGEPDLWVPPIGEQEWPEALVDGEAHPLSGGRLELRLLGLDEGLHEVVVGPTTLRFTTIKTLGVNVPSGALALCNRLVVRDREYSYLSVQAVVPPNTRESGEVRIAGVNSSGDEGDLPPPSPPPVFLKTGGREYVLIGPRPGQVARLKEPPRPAWIQQAGLHLQYFEANVPFPVAWVLTKWPGRGWLTEAHVSLLPADEPAEPWNEEKISDWRTVISHAPAPDGDDELTRWAVFQEMARANRDER
jgi:hypothetical protein